MVTSGLGLRVFGPRAGGRGLVGPFIQMGDTGSVTDRRAGSQGHHRLPGRQRLAGWFLGLAGGLGVNALSADVGYRGVAAAVAVAAILISSNWVRQFPPTAPFTRIEGPSILRTANPLG